MHVDTMVQQLQTQYENHTTNFAAYVYYCA